MTKNRTPTPVYLDPGMHSGLEVKGLTYHIQHNVFPFPVGRVMSVITIIIKVHLFLLAEVGLYKLFCSFCKWTLVSYILSSQLSAYPPSF